MLLRWYREDHDGGAPQLPAPGYKVGTMTGQPWIGRHCGEDGDCMFESLPSIHCVNTSVV